ncbi:MAG: penicillin acylase family protein [Pyrodictiaceae archaeon]
MKTLKAVAGFILIILAIVPTAFFLLTPTGRVLAFFSEPLKGLWSMGIASKRPTGKINLEGLRGQVIVVWDKYGVPHIYGDYERDVFQVFGYIQACDRLWQMDFQRRVVYGRLSEILGEPAYNVDKYMRMLGLGDVARASWRLIRELAEQGDKAAARTVEAIEAFTQGVNQCIDHMLSTGKLPLEYRILGVKPDHWSPEDCMAIAKLVDYGLSFSIDDLEWGLVASYAGSWVLGLYLDYAGWLDKLGRRIIADVSEVYTNHSLGEEFAGEPPIAEPSDAMVLDYYVNLKAMRPLLEGYLKLAYSAARLIGLEPGEQWFSNNWVVHGMHTRTGYPLLANDPHLALSVPPVWYEAHLVARDTGLNVYGVAFPGIPFIIIGRNKDVAFGFTNSMIDVVDLYYYVWKNGKYFYKGKWLEPKKHVEKILVRTGKGLEERSITILETVHGRIVEFQVGNKTYRLAVKATTLIPSPVAVWAYLIDHARSVMDFIRAQRYFYSPIQNAVVADAKGNILYAPVGLVPVRTRLPLVKLETPRGSVVVPNTGFLPYNGSRGEGEWIGYIPFYMLPRLLNPSWGYVATANNMISYSYLPGNNSMYLQWSFLDSYRWMRINEMLVSKLKRYKLSVNDMKEIQMDYHSAALRQVLGILLKTMPSSGLGEVEDKALTMLRKWAEETNYSMDANRPEPSIAYAWAYMMLKKLWGRLASKAGMPFGYDEILHLLRLEILEYVFSRALQGDTWYLEKIAGTSNLTRIAIDSFKDAIKYLENFYRTRKVEDWIWGKAHMIRAEHILGSILPWLNYKPLEAPGGPFTVNVAPMIGLGNGVSHGPSVRFIADLSPGATGLIVIPGGDSGSPFSPYYDNQFVSWLRGAYHAIRLDDEPNKLSDIAVDKLIAIGG